ncbi:tail fiber domain-containing protein [bacterium]|nr:tail fiber domain-containing protein [bacterium]
MKQKIVKQVNYWLGVTAIGLVLGLSLQFARAWTEPAVAPPGGNVGAPINTGPVYQSKAAGLEINGNLDLQGAWRILTFDNGAGDQQLFGDGSSALYFDSNHDTVTQMLFRDKQNTQYGRIYGSGNGNNYNFGLLDGDGNWSYLAVKDNYTQFRINNSAKMTIHNNGNVGIGTTTPGYKLDINTDNAAPLRVTGDSSVVWNRASIYSRDTAASGRIFAFGSRAGTFSISDETAGQRRFTINSGGNVGIGTASPGYKLQVDGTVGLNNTLYMRDIGATSAVIDLRSEAGDWSRIYSENYGGNLNRLVISTGDDGDNDYIVLRNRHYNNGNKDVMAVHRSKVTIDGNLGIGDTSPDSKLDVDNGDIRISTGGSGLIFPDGSKQTTAAVGTDLHGWSFQNDKLLDDGENVIQTSDEWLRLNQQSQFTNGIYTPRLIRADGGFQVDGKWAISNNNYTHRAQSTDNTHYGYFEARRADGQRGAYFGWGSPGNYVNLRLESGNDLAITGGNVGIGTASPTQKLDVNGTVKANAFIYSSDERLKKDVENIPGALERILNLRGVLFKWKENDEQSLGLIAQEAEKVFPELVVTSQIDGMKAVKYGNLVAPLIEAVKEQQEQIDLLKKEIKQLKLSK